MTTLNQWLEGKKKKLNVRDREFIGAGSSRRSMTSVHEENKKCKYNDAISDLQASLPTLLSTMEAEIRERIGADEEYTLPDPKHLFLAGSAKGDNEEIKWAKHCVDKNADRNRERAIRNAERSRILAIIHSYFKTQI